jgi:hypothetical protein
MAIKNFVICVFGLLALVFGSITSIEDIVKLYTEGEGGMAVDTALSHALNNITSDVMRNMTTAVTDALEFTTVLP